MSTDKTSLCPLFGVVCDFSRQRVTSSDVRRLVYICRREFTRCERYQEHMAARAGSSSARPSAAQPRSVPVAGSPSLPY